MSDFDEKNQIFDGPTPVNGQLSAKFKSNDARVMKNDFIVVENFLAKNVAVSDGIWNKLDFRKYSDFGVQVVSIRRLLSQIGGLMNIFCLNQHYINNKFVFGDENRFPFIYRSFANYIIEERLPIILTKVIVCVSEEKAYLEDKYDQETIQKDMKDVIINISQLKYEMRTNKELALLTGEEIDKEIWNEFLKNLPINEKSYFSCRWMYAECYMYRKLQSIFGQTTTLKTFDCFRAQKRNALTTAYKIIRLVLTHTNEFYGKANHTPKELEEFFHRLLKIALWGNRCDLSISVGKAVEHVGDPFTALESFDECLLVNNSQQIWSCVQNGNASSIIDIVQDNCGYECFTDFLLIDFLLKEKLCGTIRFHVKAIPWFISDVRKDDLHWTIASLSKNADSLLSEFGHRLGQYVDSGQIQLFDTEFFWTSPYEYQMMEEINPELYATLCEAHLVIFKGDLNYRKLLADMNTPFSATFVEVLRNFRPTNLCAIRTIKADLICELKDGVGDELEVIDHFWMEIGKYGLIQFAPKI